MASKMTSTARSAGPTDPAEKASSAVGLGAALTFGALGAVAAWIGWLELAPTLGFPRLSPAGMLNRILGMASDAPLGWAVLIAGLAGLAAGFVLAAARGLSRPGLLSGATYGLVLWLLTGAILMPLMGMWSPAVSAPSSDALMQGVSEPQPALMRETFMMLHLGVRAPIGALIAWQLFGGVLGAASSRLPDTRGLRRRAVSSG